MLRGRRWRDFTSSGDRRFIHSQDAPDGDDDLDDPAAHFTRPGEDHIARVEARLAQRQTWARDERPDAERHGAMQDVEWTTARTARAGTDVGLDDPELVRDPRRLHTDDLLPRAPHRLHELVAEPGVGAAEFRRAWRSWLDTLPVEAVLVSLRKPARPSCAG